MKENRFKRLWQHWLHPRWRVEKYFPTAELERISKQIGLSEQHHLGQIRFVIESRYDSVSVLKQLLPRTRAWQWFGELGVWNTALNSGVLVYVSFADHAVEVVADRGIAAKVSQEHWQRVCNLMRHSFEQGRFIVGLDDGLQAVNEILCRELPRETPAEEDELPNDVVLR